MNSGWQKLDEYVRAALRAICCALLLLMVLVTCYTVVMRYVFFDPPFWGDTVTMFANIWLVMFAFALAAREGRHIAMQGFYALISPVTALALDVLWNVMVLAVGMFLVYYGYEAASKLPGQFWELGGLPKRYPTMIMPVAGALIALAAVAILVRDVLDLKRKLGGERGW